MSETNDARLARYRRAIWAKANTNAAVRAVVAVADAEQADYVAIVERLTSERDKAREDCGFHKGLKESIREELSTFIRLKVEAESALASEREAHAGLREAAERVWQTFPYETVGGHAAHMNAVCDLRAALAEPAEATASRPPETSGVGSIAPVAAEEGGEQEAGEWVDGFCTCDGPERDFMLALSCGRSTHRADAARLRAEFEAQRRALFNPAPSGSDEQGDRPATPDANGVHDTKGGE